MLALVCEVFRVVEGVHLRETADCTLHMKIWRNDCCSDLVAQRALGFCDDTWDTDTAAPSDGHPI